MRARVGIHDVARAAGVSATTVSHALSGRGKVSAETRVRVVLVAKDLGYEPNRLASALRNRRTGVLGFVSDEIASTPFVGRIVLGAQDAAASRDVTLMVVNSNRSAVVEQRQIEMLRSQQVDALLYARMFHRVVDTPTFGTAPVVLVNSEDPDVSVSSISPDEFHVGMDATHVLLDAGHRRIAHITIDEPGPAVDRRHAGYRAAMDAAGLLPHVVRSTGPADARAGRRGLEQTLEESPSTTAVFAFNDPMAMGVYQSAALHGLRVPDDLSVVAVDNLELIAAQLLPALTTFELPHYEMGRWAVTTAMRRLDDPEEPVDVMRIRCHMVSRGSVARSERP